jgi:hypothetical protein
LRGAFNQRKGLTQRAAEALHQWACFFANRQRLQARLAPGWSISEMSGWTGRTRSARSPSARPAATATEAAAVDYGRGPRGHTAAGVLMLGRNSGAAHGRCTDVGPQQRRNARESRTDAGPQLRCSNQRDGVQRGLMSEYGYGVKCRDGDRRPPIRHPPHSVVSCIKLH